MVRERLCKENFSCLQIDGNNSRDEFDPSFIKLTISEAQPHLWCLMKIYFVIIVSNEKQNEVYLTKCFLSLRSVQKPVPV